MFTAWLGINYLINSDKIRNLKQTLIALFVLFNVSSAIAQELGELTGSFKLRHMRTANRRDLANFSGAVSYGYLKYDRKINDWLTFGGQANGLMHFGIDNITKRDAITGAGPIYEANLWNPSQMSGQIEVGLPQLYAKLNFGQHRITIGRFLQQTPTISPESWPFPNGLQGVWYEYDANEKLKVQLGAIHRISPRFTGRFDKIGETIGLVAVGVDEFGTPNTYPGNVSSEFIAIANVNWSLTDNLTIDFWNYLTQNVDNTMLIEPTLKLAGDLTLKAMFIYQFKIGAGGNDNPLLTYLEDGHKASSYGFRAEKKHGNHTFQVNFSRISDDGNLNLRREWGREPFYTFQRRTRVEGMRDVTSIMAKWQRNWDNEKRRMAFFTSFGGNNLKDPRKPLRNKLGLPSHVHWDADIKYTPKEFFVDGLSAELYIAYRFLNDEIGINEAFRINRADFFHTDLILAYTF